MFIKGEGGHDQERGENGHHKTAVIVPAGAVACDTVSVSGRSLFISPWPRRRERIVNSALPWVRKDA